MQKEKEPKVEYPVEVKYATEGYLGDYPYGYRKILYFRTRKKLEMYVPKNTCTYVVDHYGRRRRELCKTLVKVTIERGFCGRLSYTGNKKTGRLYSHFATFDKKTYTAKKFRSKEFRMSPGLYRTCIGDPFDMQGNSKEELAMRVIETYVRHVVSGRSARREPITVERSV